MMGSAVQCHRRRRSSLSLPQIGHIIAVQSIAARVVRGQLIFLPRSCWTILHAVMRRGCETFGRGAAAAKG